MPLTRDFRVTIRERLESDPGFREALLEEGVQCLLAGEVDVGKSGSARLRQRDHRVSGTRRVDREVAQESDAHAQSERQSAGAQSLRDHQLPSGTRGTAPQSTGGSVTDSAP